MTSKFPPWIRMKIPAGGKFANVKNILDGLKLNTVCQQALCPNRGECWSAGTATFMVLGTVCTRSCPFCGVPATATDFHPQKPDPCEAERICDAVEKLSLKFVVLTSVTRDDLEDGGAEHIASVVERLRERFPSIFIEVLIPDILPPYLGTIIESGIDVLAHNVEVPERLTPVVRDARASYKRSLEVLRKAKMIAPHILTKSSLILGLGETKDEVIKTMRELKDCNVDLLTLGQYLQPMTDCVPVVRFVEPEEWEEFKAEGEKMGFKKIFAGPMVRSSYLASKLVEGL